MFICLFCVSDIVTTIKCGIFNRFYIFVVYIDVYKAQNMATVLSTYACSN